MIMMRSVCLSFLLSSLFFSIIADAATNASSSVQGASEKPLQLNYTLYAGGLRVVDVGLSWGVYAQRYDINAEAHTRGIWATLVPWQNTITVHGQLLSHGQAKPTMAQYNSIWREKLQSMEMNFAEKGDVSVVSNPPQKPDGRREATQDDLKGAMDPVSAIVTLTARLNQNAGTDACVGKIPAFDGRRLYNLVLTSKGEEELAANDYNLYAGKALRCEVTFEPIAGFPVREKRRGFWSASDNNNRKNPLIIWIAKPNVATQSVVVRVQSTVQLGTIIAHLTGINQASPQP